MLHSPTLPFSDPMPHHPRAISLSPVGKPSGEKDDDATTTQPAPREEYTFCASHWALVLPADGSPMYYSTKKPPDPVLKAAARFSSAPGMTRVSLHDALQRCLDEHFVVDFVVNPTRASDLYWCATMNETEEVGMALFGAPLPPADLGVEDNLIHTVAFTLEGSTPRSKLAVNRYFTVPDGDAGRLIDADWDEFYSSADLDSSTESLFLRAPLCPSVRPNPPHGDVLLVFCYDNVSIPFPDQLAPPSIKPPCVYCLISSQPFYIFVSIHTTCFFTRPGGVWCDLQAAFQRFRLRTVGGFRWQPPAYQLGTQSAQG